MYTPPPKQLNTLWRWWRREWRREQTADNSNSTHCHEALQEVAQLENRDCVAALLPSFSSWNQPDAVSCRRTAQKEEKEVQKPINKKYEAGDYMHPQWSTQGPQPLGGIVSVIASLALQIVVTNFLLSLKITFKFRRNGTCAKFVTQNGICSNFVRRNRICANFVRQNGIKTKIGTNCYTVKWSHHQIRHVTEYEVIY